MRVLCVLLSWLTSIACTSATCCTHIGDFDTVTMLFLNKSYEKPKDKL